MTTNSTKINVTSDYMHFIVPAETFVVDIKDIANM